VSVNLEWGRFDTARQTSTIISPISSTLRSQQHAWAGDRAIRHDAFLLARYFHYTGDRALLLKHQAKIRATAKLLADMHELSLRLRRTIRVTD